VQGSAGQCRAVDQIILPSVGRNLGYLEERGKEREREIKERYVMRESRKKEMNLYCIAYPIGRIFGWTM